ncbi:hypothetical protein [Actinoplanes regularis]|uniref:hypothetical protein n=1 Tax=Actinoplanes regularis TaxID=52697 RepID=UPI0025574300|nr:hypothetical protein [Actinoplanes regularis]
MSARLREILNFVVAHAVDLVVFPESAIPVECLDILREFSAQCVIVAGLGRIRNEAAAEPLGESANLVGRNVSVLVEAGQVVIYTKAHPAETEECERGDGPWDRTLRFGEREVRVCVAVCLDYLREEEKTRMAGAEIVCIPAWSTKSAPFRPDAPRDHVRLFANCARHGGSTIMLPGLRESRLQDERGVLPVHAGYEAVVIVDYDKYPQRPSGLVPPENRLVARAEIVEEDSQTHKIFAELTGLHHAHRFEAPVADLARRHREIFPPRNTAPGPFAEAVDSYQSLLDQRDHDSRAAELALNHLVVAHGNRPAAIRRRQAAVAFQALPGRADGDVMYAALALYQDSSSATPRRFDSSRYVERVLRPIRAESVLPAVRDRYALHPAMTPRELAARVDEVVKLWKRQARGSVPVLAEACRRLLQDHDDLAPRLSDPQWWIEQPDPAPVAPVLNGDNSDADHAEPPEPVPVQDAPPKPAREAEPITLSPPRNLRIRWSGNAVHVNWTAPEDAPPRTHYRITRWDGEEEVLTGTIWTGGKPPLGVVAVEVRAEATGAVSPPATASMVIAPGVQDFHVRLTASNEVQGRWRTEPYVRQVSIRRETQSSSGAETSTAEFSSTGEGFHDAAPIGRHRYTVVPIYEFPDGTEARGEASQGAITTYPVPPVPGPLSWRVRSDGYVRLDHPPLDAGVTLTVLRTEADPEGGVGDLVLTESLDHLGSPAPILAADRKGCVVELPDGTSIIVPFAVAGELAVRGAATTVAHILPLDPTSERRDGIALISWRWPNDITLARMWVRWGHADAEPEIRDVSMAEYLRLGGVELHGTDRAFITVAGLLHTAGDPLVGTPSEVVTQPQPNTVTYTIARPWWDLFRWSGRRRITIRSTFPCADVDLRIVLREAGPAQAREAVLFERSELRLDPDEPVTVHVTMPGPAHIRRPCYVWVNARSGPNHLRIDDMGGSGRETD